MTENIRVNPIEFDLSSKQRGLRIKGVGLCLEGQQANPNGKNDVKMNFYNYIQMTQSDNYTTAIVFVNFKLLVVGRRNPPVLGDKSNYCGIDFALTRFFYSDFD